MNIWIFYCISTSHALFFSFSAKTCWGLWMIVWIWAFFFLLAYLGSFHRGNWFGPPKPIFLFELINKRCGFEWKPEINMDRALFFILFLKMVLSCFPNHQSTWILIDVDLIAFLYDLELGFHFCFLWQTKLGFFFGTSLPCPFEPSFSFLMWYNKVLSKCQIWVSRHRIVKCKFIKFCPKI